MINKQSNIYTIVYIIVMVAIVGVALCYLSTSLQPLQKENADADKMKQILLSVHIASNRASVVEDYNRYITSTTVVNSKGETIGNASAFAIDVAAEAKKTDINERLLPVYICSLPQQGIKYIIPLAGMGLWGPIWGYVSLDEDGSTIYGAFFDHQGETPGLGAEISKDAFTSQFNGKEMFKNNTFLPIEVVKKGQSPAGASDYVDGVSGGTITSKGVSAMLDNCLQPYKAYLENIRNK